MGEYGKGIVLEGTPEALATGSGETLRLVSELGFEPWDGAVVGLLLQFDAGDVACFNIADEMEIVTWSDAVADRFSLVLREL
jgi:hypothetical protein